MRSVRCDVCGTKALMAASKCPKCGHQFSVRDGFGDMLPLSHCSTCDSDYPASIGSCKWCGTTPQRAPVAPHIWKGVGIVAFVGMAWGAWMVHDDKPTQAAATSQLQGLLKPDSSAISSDSARPTETLASEKTVDRDTSTSVVLADTLAQPMLAGIVPSSDSITSVQSAGAIAEPEPAPAVDTTRVVPVARETVAREPVRETARESVREPVPAPARVRAPARKAVRPPAAASSRATPRGVVRPPATAKAPPRVAVAPKTSPRSRKSASRWTSTIARNWVIVRADPNKKSRIVASIGPNTRVQLGEARGEWRRIKTKGLAGWVEHRLLLARTSLAPSRGSRLAAR